MAALTAASTRSLSSGCSVSRNASYVLSSAPGATPRCRLAAASQKRVPVAGSTSQVPMSAAVVASRRRSSLTREPSPGGGAGCGGRASAAGGAPRDGGRLLCADVGTCRRGTTFGSILRRARRFEHWGHRHARRAPGPQVRYRARRMDHQPSDPRPPHRTRRQLLQAAAVTAGVPFLHHTAGAAGDSGGGGTVGWGGALGTSRGATSGGGAATIEALQAANAAATGSDVGSLWPFIEGQALSSPFPLSFLQGRF